MANPPKPWKAEYAKSSRSSCKTCKIPIEKEILRLGKMVQATQFDGFMPNWNHADCIFRKANQITAVDDVEGLELLRWEDQQKIRKYVEAGGGPTKGTTKASAPSVTECGIEISQTSRASCRKCSEKITKGEVRVSFKPANQNARSLAWHHVKCFTEMYLTVEVDKFAGWNSLSAADQAAVLALVKPASSTAKGKKLEPVEEPFQGSVSNAGAKRKITSGNNGKSKVAKSEVDCGPEQTVSGTKSTKMTEEPSKGTDLESQLEAQSRSLWALKDDLKKHVSTVELRQMLEINSQDSTGPEHDLRERCADGMLFGPLATCPLCKGFLRYSSGMYKCDGYLTEWSKCSYSTTEPEHVKGKWKIPEETDNEYLLKWFKSQKLKKPSRIMPRPTPTALNRCQSSNAMSKGSRSEELRDLKVSIAGSSKDSVDEWKNRIEAVGVQVHKKIKKDTNCLVVIEGLDDQDAEMRKARKMKLPILRVDYLEDCIKRGKSLPFDLYKIETVEDRKSIVTVKVKGRSAVHEASGLQDSGHILEDGKSIYNTTLSMSDLSTGVNSYYILQIIQDDKRSDCCVFRKWGRVGNEKIGGTKLDEMTKSDAINEFKRLFLEKTGNTWEVWEGKNFQKQPGRFYPLDIDYGVNRDVSRKKSLTDTKSRLAPSLVELMKTLFNVETYRAAMMEFEINMSEMPLGKLSKSNIQKGFEALTEIQNLLSGSAHNAAMMESLIVDASNRFFTLIPSIHPHVIRDENDFKSKVKMLEALQDIEIASRLIGFDVDDNETLDEKYKKLGCDISPIPHDSEDYRLVEKYLQTTHAPTHTEWSLELEEVFALERPGEYDKYCQYREKLGNRMLLWHGSRLTNFVGILSQGLRIAPPEAPATGYMFGKGIYFADLVSKSAQYCFTDRNNPVGLMVLSEVALGEVYELKKAKYMDKPPKGKHSTKGLGKKVPHESDFVKWRDGVVVPCGKPVSSTVSESELMYNEYIVYNTSQVKLQFLLKVRFRHKR